MSEQQGDTATKKRTHYKGPLELASPEAEPAPTRSSVDTTLFKQHLQASWNDVQNKSETPSRGFTVPEGGAQLVETRFRQAAADLNLGVTVRIFRTGEAGAERYNLQEGQARVVICAKPRMQKNKDQAQAAPAAPVVGQQAAPIPHPAQAKGGKK